MDKAKRRTLKVLGGTLGAGAFAYAMEPLRAWAKDLTLDQFLQRHYKELTPDEMETILRTLEQDAKKN